MRAHPIRRMLAVLLCAACATAMSVVAPIAATGAEQNGRPAVVRFATFNASLNRGVAGELIEDLSSPANAQAATVAEIIQRVRPDVLLINEFDFDSGGTAARLFQENYLSLPHNGAAPIEYPYRFVAPSNTGIASGFDLNNDDAVGGPDDAFGFGFFPGQFGMAVYSMHPILLDDVRTFQMFLWADMPGALLPDDPATPEPADWFSAEELAAVRLSSKSHWDLPIDIDGRIVHLLASHPTPPVFDGPEDRNGRRNHDEIRFWADYVTPGKASAYIYDDAGARGGLRPGARFVIAGDQNADPLDGDSVPGAAQLLLEHPRVNTSVTPASEGAVDAAERQGGANLTHRSDPAFDTADFADSVPGNLRADYVLPSRPLRFVDAAVFWPTADDPLFRLVGDFPFPSSDHRLVWIDVAVPGGPRR
jgi:3-phytase